MTYLVRLQPVTGDPARVVALLLRILGPAGRRRALMLVRRGGVVRRGLAKPAAQKLVEQLRQAGAEAEIGEDSVTDHDPAPDRPTPDRPTPDRPTPDRPTPDRPTPDRPTPDRPTPDDADPAEPMLYRVAGTVVLPGGEPAVGYGVEAEDRDLRSVQPLGATRTDKRGRYAITYVPRAFADGERGGPDLHLRVASPTGAPLDVQVVGRDVVRLGGLAILFNAGPKEEVDLAIATAPEAAQPSRYERLVDALQPLPAGVTLRDLTDDDVLFLHHDTGADRVEIAYAADDARLSTQAELPLSVFYGWASRQIGVVEGDGTLPRIDLDAVLAEGVDPLMEAFEAVRREGVIPYVLGARAKAIHARLKALVEARAAATTAPGLADLHAAAAQTTADLAGQPAAAVVRQRAATAVRAQLDAAFADAPAAVRDVVAHLDLQTLPPEAPLADAVADALDADPAVDEQTAAAAMAHLGTDGVPRTVGAVLQPTLPLDRNPLVADDLRRARLVEVARVAGLEGDDALKLLDGGSLAQGFSNTALKRHVAGDVLADDQARTLGFTTDLSGLVGDDALTESLSRTSFDVLGGRPPQSTRDLARLSAEALRPLVEAAQTGGDGGAGPDAATRAAQLAARFEYLHPDEAVFARLLPRGRDVAPPSSAVDAILTSAPDPFAPGFTLPADADPDVKAEFERIRRLGNTFAGLGLPAVLQDPDLAPQEKAARAEALVGQLQQFREANADRDLLALDLTATGTDAAALDWGGLDGDDRTRVLGALKTYQLAYGVARSAPVADLLLQSGYTSALAIAATSYDRFQAQSGLSAADAQAVYGNAQATTGYVTAVAGSIIDVLKGGFNDLFVGNLGTSIDDFLGEIDGYEDLFGSLDFCACEHCQSIFSPAAYFVDLMLFVEEHVLDRHFDGGDSTDPINLKVRRPDLWTLELTCENTNGLVPTLQLVAEILENYIAERRGFGGSLATGPAADRNPVEDFVYRTQLAATQSSFEQPFLRPLRELETYLSHFDRTRADVADVLGADALVAGRARLGLSEPAFALVTTASEDEGALEQLYDLDFTVDGGGGVTAFDAQELLGPTGLTRTELGDLVATDFVNGGGGAAVEIRSEKRGADSVQNDIERIHNLTLGTLDRMHRFVRLWRHLPWTIRELDLVAATLDGLELSAGLDADLVRHVAALHAVQARLGVTVEESLALFTAIPRTAITEDGEALFDRLFNQTGFLDLGAPYPQPATAFIHPAWQAGNDTADVNRLVAGLRVSDEALYALIVHLAAPLGVDLASADSNDQGVALSEENLALLYRHARLAEDLDLSVDALFQLLSFLDTIPGDHVATFDDLQALLDGYDRWDAAPYTLDELGALTGGIVLDEAAQPDPDAAADTIVQAVADEQALTFADTVLAYLDDVSETQSRAILAANPAAVVAVDETGLLRLADEFDPDAPLALPADVAADEGAVREVLAGYHVSRVLPSYLATQLDLALDKAEALLALVGADLGSAGLAAALRGDDPAPLVALLTSVDPAYRLLAPDALTAGDVAFVAAQPDLFAIADPAVLTPEAAWRVAAYHRLLTSPPLTRAADEDAEAYRADLQAVLLGHDAAAGFDGADPATLAGLFDVEVGLLTTLTALDLTGVAVHALERLHAAAALARHLGVGGGALQQIVSETYDPLALARDAVRGAIRAKYADEATWTSVIEPFEEQILRHRRDALVDYLLRAGFEQFDAPGDLYTHFLIDVEVDSCARTSRVVEATASLQLYVHRCLMNLEQDRRPADDPNRTHVEPQDVPADEWAWRKNYRVWEANRKVFLYPETYIEPELRDNKTPLFEELEQTLLQQPITEQSVLDAYAEYVRGYEEVAHLQIAGAYHDEGGDADVLHLFGATAQDPPQYYYRTIENLILSETDPARGVVYGAWRKVNVQIPVRYASPVVFRGTLYLFWNEIATRPNTRFDDGESVFEGYLHNVAFKYTTRRLDGTWSAPQNLDLSPYTEYPFSAGPGVLDEHLSTHILGYKHPYYTAEMHTEARDGHTLRGARFDRLYPDPHEDGTRLYLTGMSYKLHASVDFYKNAVSNRDGSYVDLAIQWTGSIERGKLVTTRSHDDHWDLYLSTPDQHRFDDYAFASIVADSRRIDEAALTWDGDGDLEAAIRGDLYAAWLARLPAPTDVMVVNGAVSDAILDLGGDLLYVQGSARDGNQALVRRLGTTLAEDVGRTLVTSGVAGLLALDAQRAFQEAASPLYDVQSRLDDAVNAGALDFKGAYGTYYRELFFHIPFLIANHLNSQRLFAEAQKWYHYLFDPTAPVEPAATGETDEQARRDRPWRYLEFRGLDAAKLRDLLTDPAAIEVYEKDPFNPHAIARLRLSAYQKTIVMKYIDNLIDWGDALFTRDTREAITEATMLYVMASDILGDRPAELGSCGEGQVSPKTYEGIRPLMDADSPFLIELERYVYYAMPAFLTSVVADGVYALGTAAVRDAVKGADRLTLQRTGGVRAFASPLLGVRRAAGDVRLAATVDVIDRSAEPGYAGGVAAAAGDAAGQPVAGPVYRADWNRTQTATWVSAGTPVTAAAAQAGGAVSATAAVAAGAASTAVATQVRPDLLNDVRLPSFGLSLVRQVSPVFCIPNNQELDDYWNRVEDRLYKIRHCMNIRGVRRQLALFAPPIDPRLLVRARAAGLSLDEALGLTAGELPPYRFAALIGRAKSYAGTVQGFGGALLSALEKKDAEELHHLRLTHQENLAALTTAVRRQQVDAAQNAVEVLYAKKAAVEYTRAYYQGLVDTGLTSWEIAQGTARHTSSVLKGGAALLDTLAGVLHLVPQIGAPTAMKYGGIELGSSADNFAGLMRDLSGVADAVAASAGLEAGFQRRHQGWEHQVEQTDKQLGELEKQIEGAELRRDIATEQLALHEHSIEQTREMIDFYGEKFTGLGLYTWLSSTLQRLYREAYNSALAMARLAEQAFRFERPDLGDVALSPAHWDAGHAGLLAGEQLLLELHAMERRFIETDDRRMEVDQAFSLQQIDPAALLQLKQTGQCTFTLPELYFDLFYPGQYRRVVKAVRLTIPCVTGPYANVSATLTLLGSEIRTDPDPATAPAPAPTTRTATVATSTAQNDAGVFELAFRGERYLPFEGAGAVNSQWQLTLPRTFRPFDYDSINDVILRISYQAEFDGLLRERVEDANADLEGTLARVLRDQGLARAFSLRQEFATTFHRLLQAGMGESVPFEITEQHFPLFLRGRALNVTRALLAVQTDGTAPGALSLSLDGTVHGGFATLPELGDLPGVDVTADFGGDPRGAHTLAVAGSGDLAPGGGAPPALDTDRVHDVVLYIEYSLDL